MSIINYVNKEIQFKVVYYGPALCGKTTNLTYIHSQVADAHKGELVSLATAADRTLFFDFLPLNAVVIKGFKTKFQLYTVPGQVIYNATRQLVLRSVDGIVFVADSQWEKMEENVESFKNLQENLARQGTALEKIPYVLQYNKRDLPNPAPVHYLEYILNNRPVRVPSFEAVATTGQGVFATLNAIARLLLQKFARDAEAAAASKQSGRLPAAQTALSGIAAAVSRR
jgi:signal recognition particle receptor subunit beta